MRPRVLIIGGSSGIGLASAQRAQREGFDVLIASRSRDRLLAAVRRIGDHCQGRVLDMTDGQAVEAFFASSGSFDHLVISGGQPHDGRFGTMSLAAARAAFEVKFWGPYACLRAAAGKIRQSITLVSGISSEKPFSGLHATAATNGAVEALARSLAVELAPLRVNVVAPGLIDTPVYDRLAPDQRERVFHEVAERIPAHRVGKPEDVAAAIVGLMTSPYCTGVVLPVDGGHRLAG
jgi:NAD(P)-dependent dehydrogenase (short-subunit alcohol dehydrogenase family)